MNNDLPIANASIEKTLLLLTVGFLHALKAEAIAGDEALYTIGIPRIVALMAARGISDEVANLVSQRDEFEWLREMSGTDSLDAAISEAIGECLSLLRSIPLTPTRTPPILGLLSYFESDR